LTKQYFNYLLFYFVKCSLPCEIPTNLLGTCEYICKNQHPFCIDSCKLLTKLSEQKDGTCPQLQSEQLPPPPPLPPSSSSLVYRSVDQCNNQTFKELTIKSITNNNNNNDDVLIKCNKDSDCGGIQKCCSIEQKCPQMGSVCQKPTINDKSK
jgi:hypothetical protein